LLCLIVDYFFFKRLAGFAAGESIKFFVKQFASFTAGKEQSKYNENMLQK